LYFVIGCASVAVLALFGARLLPVRAAAAIDMFPLDHPVAEGSGPVKRPTQVGAACTVAFLVAAGAISTSLALQFILSNAITTHGLIPAAMLPGAAPGAPAAFTSQLTLVVTYADGDANACNLRGASRITHSGITVASSEASVAFSGGACVLTHRARGVHLNAESAFELAQPSWLAQRFTWTLTSDSALDFQSLSVASGGAWSSTPAVRRLNGTARFPVSVTATTVVDANGANVGTGILVVGVGQTVAEDDGSAILTSDTVTLLVALQVRRRRAAAA
jgi:hypothetical protein